MKTGDIIAGRYELREQIGNGRWALFAALDRQMSRRVAVRIFDTAHANPEALQRYASALSVAAAIEHPSVVVPRIQLATFETPPFVVGDALEGENLGSLCGRVKTLPWERAVAVVLACLEGLAVLKRATGLAHRALRPGNVWLAANGRTQILDFGIAELGVSPTTPRSDGSHVEYRAPEQLEGTAGDARSDIFSIGVMLFEMLTGVHPFSGPNAAAVRIKIQMHAAPCPSQLTPRVQIPAVLEALIGRMLARRAKDRPADHTILIRELSGLLPAPAEAPEPPMAVGPPETRQPVTPPATALPPLVITDPRPTVAARNAPFVDPPRKPPKDRQHVPAVRPEPADVTLILPEERTERDRPFRLAERAAVLPTSGDDEALPSPDRSVDRTLALPFNNAQDPDDQITLTRANLHRLPADRTEVIAKSGTGPLTAARERDPSVDGTRLLVRSAPRADASDDVTEIHAPSVYRPTAAPGTASGPREALEDEVTTYRPRPALDRLRAAPGDVPVTDDTLADPRTVDPPEPSGPTTHGNADATVLTAPRLIALNLVLLVLLLGFYWLAR